LRITELVTRLESLRAVHGDVLVAVADADSGMTLGITDVSFDMDDGAVSIGGNYRSDANLELIAEWNRRHGVSGE